MEFGQALCRITTFEQKALKHNRKLLFRYDNRETFLENQGFAMKIENIYENQ